MREFLSAHAQFTVKSGMVDLVEPLTHYEALGPVAAQMVDILKASPFGVMDRSSLIEECTAAGIPKGTSNIWTTYAEWMQNFGRNVWGLRGITVVPSVVEEVQAATVRRSRNELRERSWSWTSDGQLKLTADVNTSLWTTGVVNFSTSLRQMIGARQFVVSHRNGTGGTLSFSEEHDWAWGWGRPLHDLGAKVGDTIQATLDLSASSAWVEVGERSLFE